MRLVFINFQILATYFYTFVTTDFPRSPETYSQDQQKWLHQRTSAEHKQLIKGDDRNATEEEKPQQLLIYCKICSHLKWTEIENFIEKTVIGPNATYRPMLVKDHNYTAAKIYRVKSCPALVINMGNKRNKYDEKWPWKAEEVKKWIDNSVGLVGGQDSSFAESLDITLANIPGFNDIIQKSLIVSDIWIILLTKGERSDVTQTKNAEAALAGVKDLMKNTSIVHIIKIDASPDDDIMIRHQLSVSVMEEACPVAIMLRDGYFYNLNYNCFGVNAFQELFNNAKTAGTGIYFLDSTEKNNKRPNRQQWRKVHEAMGELEFLFISTSQKLDHQKFNKTFIVVGVTGGIAVIALAISIFWGLKSSS